MRIDYQTKNYKPKDTLKDVIEKKVQKLDKYFDDDVTVKVAMRESNDREKMELTIFLGGTVLRSEVSGKRGGETMYDLIDLALPKLERQIVKFHKILASKRRKGRRMAVGEDIKEEEKKTNEIVRTKSFDLAPMDEIEAMAELEMVGHSFFVFLNKASGKVNVIYKRNDGNYGIIEANV